MRRTWQIGPYRDERGEFYSLDPGEQDREMVALGVMLSRMGGSAVVAPLRIKQGDDFTTVGLAFKYETGNVPAVEAQRAEDLPQADEIPEPPIEPEPVPEPVVEAIPEPALAE